MAVCWYCFLSSAQAQLETILTHLTASFSCRRFADRFARGPAGFTPEPPLCRSSRIQAVLDPDRRRFRFRIPTRSEKQCPSHSDTRPRVQFAARFQHGWPGQRGPHGCSRSRGSVLRPAGSRGLVNSSILYPLSRALFSQRGCVFPWQSISACPLAWPSGLAPPPSVSSR